MNMKHDNCVVNTGPFSSYFITAANTNKIAKMSSPYLNIQKIFNKIANIIIQQVTLKLKIIEERRHLL